MEDNANSYFDKILQQLLALDYYKQPRIYELEKQILHGTTLFTDELPGLISYLQCLVMLGDNSKATAVAKRIWEIGGQLEPKFEALYTDNLINLGLQEMTEILLRPRYENIPENFEYFGSVMEKFALQQGNFLRLAKLLQLAPIKNYNPELAEILQTYRQTSQEEDFSSVMKIILEQSRSKALSYDYIFYTDRGFAEMETVIYTNQDADAGARFEKDINRKINAYYASVGKKRLNNIFVTVLMLSEHQAVQPDEQDSVHSDNQNIDSTPLSNWNF